MTDEKTVPVKVNGFIVMLTEDEVWKIGKLSGNNEAPREADMPALGDYFTHGRTGIRFVCRAITRNEHGTELTIVPEHATPAGDVK